MTNAERAAFRAVFDGFTAMVGATQAVEQSCLQLLARLEAGEVLGAEELGRLRAAIDDVISATTKRAHDVNRLRAAVLRPRP